MVRVERDEDDNFTVLADDNAVGEVVMHEKTDIAYVEIDEAHRGNGYGSRAVKAVVDRVTSETDQNIRVSTPVDESLEWVFHDLGFQEEFVMGDKILVLYQ